MILRVSAYSALCELDDFRINYIPADYEDFGNKEDVDGKNAQPYGCGNMLFTPKLPLDAILKKYSINVTEYNEVCEKLKELLSFGCCGWCV